MVEDNGIILFSDFFKAFDKLEHPFFLQSLQYFGFGIKFINIVSMLYKGITSAVLLQSGTTRRFEVKRGIRQGDPGSPLLFIIAAKLLAVFVKNNDSIKPLKVMGSSLTIIPLADDMTLFLKNSNQIPFAIKVVELFSKVSGWYSDFFSFLKSEILAIHNNPQTLGCYIIYQSKKRLNICE